MIWNQKCSRKVLLTLCLKNVWPKFFLQNQTATSSNHASNQKFCSFVLIQIQKMLEQKYVWLEIQNIREKFMLFTRIPCLKSFFFFFFFFGGGAILVQYLWTKAFLVIQNVWIKVMSCLLFKTFQERCCF